MKTPSRNWHNKFALEVMRAARGDVTLQRNSGSLVYPYDDGTVQTLAINDQHGEEYKITKASEDDDHDEPDQGVRFIIGNKYGYAKISKGDVRFVKDPSLANDYVSYAHAKQMQINTRGLGATDIYKIRY